MNIIKVEVNHFVAAMAKMQILAGLIWLQCVYQCIRIKLTTDQSYILPITCISTTMAPITEHVANWILEA